MNDREFEDKAIQEMIENKYSPLEIARIIDKPASKTSKRISEAIKSLYFSAEISEKET